MPIFEEKSNGKEQFVKLPISVGEACKINEPKALSLYFHIKKNMWRGEKPFTYFAVAKKIEVPHGCYATSLRQLERDLRMTRRTLKRLIDYLVAAKCLNVFYPNNCVIFSNYGVIPASPELRTADMRSKKKAAKKPHNPVQKNRTTLCSNDTTCAVETPHTIRCANLEDKLRSNNSDHNARARAREMNEQLRKDSFFSSGKAAKQEEDLARNTRPSQKPKNTPPVASSSFPDRWYQPPDFWRIDQSLIDMGYTGVRYIDMDDGSGKIQTLANRWHEWASTTATGLTHSLELFRESIDEILQTGHCTYYDLAQIFYYIVLRDPFGSRVGKTLTDWQMVWKNGKTKIQSLRDILYDWRENGRLEREKKTFKLE